MKWRQFEIAGLGVRWLFRCRLPVAVAVAFAGDAADVAAAAAACFIFLFPSSRSHTPFIRVLLGQPLAKRGNACYSTESENGA